MKIIPFLLFASFIDSTCVSKKEGGVLVSDDTTGLVVRTDTLPRKLLKVKDSTKYSKEFIRLLEFTLNSDATSANAELIDSAIIFPTQSKLNTVIPTYSMEGKRYSLFSRKPGFAYELHLLGLNFSDVEFEFFVKDEIKTLFTLRGVSVISPGFIYGEEMYEDEVTKVAYPAISLESNKECTFNFALGTSSRTGELLARIVDISCADPNVLQAIHDMPTLRSKNK